MFVFSDDRRRRHDDRRFNGRRGRDRLKSKSPSGKSSERHRPPLRDSARDRVRSRSPVRRAFSGRSRSRSWSPQRSRSHSRSRGMLTFIISLLCK